eukprot:2964694-Alexandrium_andersonii.AAC.1
MCGCQLLPCLLELTLQPVRLARRTFRPRAVGGAGVVPDIVAVATRAADSDAEHHDDDLRMGITDGHA